MQWRMQYWPASKSILELTILLLLCTWRFFIVCSSYTRAARLLHSIWSSWCARRKTNAISSSKKTCSFLALYALLNYMIANRAHLLDMLSDAVLYYVILSKYCCARRVRSWIFSSRVKSCLLCSRRFAVSGNKQHLCFDKRMLEELRWKCEKNTEQIRWKET